MSVQKVCEIDAGVRCGICELLFETPDLGVIARGFDGRVHKCCLHDPSECNHGWPS